jgi:hypothetical protein
MGVYRPMTVSDRCGVREGLLPHHMSIGPMSPPGYPSAWLHPCGACFRFSWRSHYSCDSMGDHRREGSQCAANRFMGFPGLAVVAAPVMLRAFFLFHGTTNPLALLDQRTPPAKQSRTAATRFNSVSCSSPRDRANFPVAIVLHGGCWSAQIGPMPKAATSLDLLRPLSAATRTRWHCLLECRVSPAGECGRGLAGYIRRSRQSRGISMRALPGPSRLDKGDRSGPLLPGGQLALWLAARPKLPKRHSAVQEILHSR